MNRDAGVESTAPPQAVPVPAGGSPATDAESTQQKSFGEWYAEGQTALDDDEHDVALAAFTKAIELDPASASAYNARGVVYLRMRKTNPTIRDFVKAIELSPKVAKFYGNRALAYRRKDEDGRAIIDLTKAIELEPTSAEWREQRGAAYYYIDDIERGKKDYEAAESLKRGSRPVAHEGAPATGEGGETSNEKLEQTALFQPLHDLAEDLAELTRCIDVNPTFRGKDGPEELRWVIDEFGHELAKVRSQFDPSRRNSTFAAYSEVHRMYDDSARVWELKNKVPELLGRYKRI